MKKNIRKYIAAFFIILILAVFRIFFFDSFMDIYNRQTKPPDYKGVIGFWDVSATTIGGSEYGFIQTICEDFANKNYGVKIDLYKIPEISKEETITLGMDSSSRPDVIRYKVGNFEADRQRLISDAEFMQELSLEYQNFIKNDYGDKLVVDVYYNISVIIVNTDILNELGVQAPSGKWNKNEFTAFLSSIQSADIKNKYRTIDFCTQNINAYLPFLLGKENNEVDDSYVKTVMDYGEADMQNRSSSEIIYDFYSGKTAVLCGDLKNVNYMIRQQAKGKGFNFEIYNYPSDAQEFIFVSDIVSYAFLDSGDADKNMLIKKFAKYMLSYDAQKYTENLGMLPCAAVGGMDYLKYPHLSKFNNIKNASYYTVRDSFIVELIKIAPSYLN